MHLTLLCASPRVAPGLLSWAAWSAVASADRRLASDLDDPLVAAVAAAGHPVELTVADRPVDVGALLAAAGDGEVVWLASAEEAERLPALLADGADGADGAVGGVGARVTVLPAPYDVPGARLLDLVTVMNRLRRDCPWDREQTHASLAPYLLEETYETLEAIESGDADHLREELGDLLLQVCFHARVASEAGPAGFTIDQVATGIVDKLVHRHPHVFARTAGADPLTAADVNRSWEALKASEKGRASVLDGVPAALPALALADRVVGRAARVGVVPGTRPSAESGSGPGSAQPLGARLLALVVEGRAAGLDAEQELRVAVRELVDTVRAQERDTAGRQPGVSGGGVR